MKHYSEAELLETYYTAPGASMPVMMHLASCSGCAARYDRLEAKLRSVAEPCDVDDRPATFWSRQRLGVQRRIEAGQRQRVRMQRFSRIAAAAVFAFLLGGAVMYETVSPEVHAVTPPAVGTAAPGTMLSNSHERAGDELARDPWQSEELSDFHNVVEWESWENESGAGREKGSL